MNRQLQRTLALLATAVLLAMLASCGSGEPIVAKTEAQVIVFPVSQKGRTEFNAAIYDIEPFTAAFRLPKGWTMREREPADWADGEFLPVGVFSIMEIYNAEGALIGAVGYNLCDIYEGEEDNPQALYSQLTVGNHYRFVVQRDTGVNGQNYIPVREDDNFACAIAPVAYFPTAASGDDWAINKGILARDKTRQVYIAMEFATDALTDEEYMAIAKSVSFLP